MGELITFEFNGERFFSKSNFMKILLLLILLQLMAIGGCISESPDQGHAHAPAEKVDLSVSEDLPLDSTLLGQTLSLFESADSVAEDKANLAGENTNVADGNPANIGHEHGHGHEHAANTNVHRDSVIVDKSKVLNDEIKAFPGVGNTQSFIQVVLILVFIYLLLSLADRFLVRRSFLGRYHKKVANWVHNLFIIYEPFALLLITVSFILINPLFFGLIVIIILLVSIRHLRNYFSGRLVQLDKSIEIGRQIKTADNQGIIHQITRFGIRLKTAKGLQFLTYPQLIWPGYTLSAGEDLGGFYRLIISKENDEPMDNIKLKDLITTVPYLDWNHDTELSMSYDQPNQVSTKVLVREDHHLQNLIALIKEWGYTCKVSKK